MNYEGGAFIEPNNIPDEAPVFRHPHYGLVEILPVVIYDETCGSGMSVQFAVCSKGIACAHEWAPLDAWHVCEQILSLWVPATSAARDVAARVCEEAARLEEGRVRSSHLKIEHARKQAALWRKPGDGT